MSHFRLFTKLTVSFALLFCHCLLVAQETSTPVVQFGITIGEHTASWLREDGGQKIYNSSGATLLGLAIDINPRLGTDYFLRARIGSSFNRVSERFILEEPSSYLFAGSKTLFAVHQIAIPISFFSISSHKIRGNMFSLGSFHYFAPKIAITDWLRIDISLPFSISPFIGTNPNDESSYPSYGIITAPSVGVIIGMLRVGYDFHAGFTRAYGNTDTMTYVGWQITVNWEL